MALLRQASSSLAWRAARLLSSSSSSASAAAAAAAAASAAPSPVTAVAVAALPLRVGSAGAVRKTVSAADVAAFAALLGDSNEIHRADFVGGPGALFGGRPVAHGMLGAGLIGTVFGSQVPGAVYVSQALRFRKPVFLGDMLEARVEVTAARPRGEARNLLTCDTRVVRVASGGGGGDGGDGVGDVVVEGEAMVLAPAS
jgi:3-hydroxybutyryl-CoA dehydratase